MAELETRTFSIGVLTRRFNVSAESLRNWERAGLIPPAHRTPGGHRRYGQDHIDAVHKLLYAPTVELGVVDRVGIGDDAVMSTALHGSAVLV